MDNAFIDSNAIVTYTFLNYSIFPSDIYIYIFDDQSEYIFFALCIVNLKLKGFLKLILLNFLSLIKK